MVTSERLKSPLCVQDASMNPNLGVCCRLLDPWLEVRGQGEWQGFSRPKCVERRGASVFNKPAGIWLRGRGAEETALRTASGAGWDFRLSGVVRSPQLSTTQDGTIPFPCSWASRAFCSLDLPWSKGRGRQGSTSCLNRRPSRACVPALPLPLEGCPVSSTRPWFVRREACPPAARFLCQGAAPPPQPGQACPCLPEVWPQFGYLTAGALAWNWRAWWGHVGQ